jgi:hypothetical protein
MREGGERDEKTREIFFFLLSFTCWSRGVG